MSHYPQNLRNEEKGPKTTMSQTNNAAVHVTLLTHQNKNGVSKSKNSD